MQLCQPHNKGHEFVQLWSSRESNTLTGSMESYLFKAAKNKALEHLKAQKAYNKHVEESLKVSFKNDDSEKMSQVYLKMERINVLLRHLSPKCRNVFVLHKYNGLTYAEIAEAESISIKTVENHMLKALKYLRENFKN